MSTDKERMEILLAHLKMNANELAVSLGHKRPDRVYHVLRERNGISTSLAREIVNVYPEVRFEWLKDGEGEIIDKESKTRERDTMPKDTNIGIPNERILFIIKHFCEGNQAEFARIMEEKPQTINGWLKRNNGNAVLKKILAKFPMVSPSWLLAGEGEMLVSSGLTKKSEDIMQTEEYILLQNKFNALLSDYKELKKEAEPLNPNAIIYVPLVNQYAHAGYLNGYQDDTYMNTLPTLPFIADNEARGNYIAFEVKGDSMDDGTGNGYVDGEILMCREIPPYLWAESKLHIRKWDFVIVHEEGIIVKRIVAHDVVNHTITVHSLNDIYPDRVIDLEEVKQIFNVIHSQRNRRR